MNITPSHIRSVVLQALLLIFLAVLRTQAQEENEQNDIDFIHTHNVSRLDSISTTSTITSDISILTTATAITTTFTTETPEFVNKLTFHKSKEINTSSSTTTESTKTVEPEATIFETTESDTYTTTTTKNVPTSESTTTADSETTSTFSDTITTTSSNILMTTTLSSSTYTSLAFASTIPFIALNNTTTNTTIQYINTSDPLVQYNLECRADDRFCRKVSKAVGAAIDEFTQVINVKNSLLIKVTYYSFCEKVCANDTLGWGTPTSQFTLPFEDGADLNYVYPQALAKQLAPYSSTSVWAKYDIEIEINHDVYLNGTDIDLALQNGWNGSGTPPNGTYWFFNDTLANNTYSIPIQSNQVDLRYVVLHELLHGLGFLSSWAAYFWTDASPFRTLVEGVIDPLELQLVTPGPYWHINSDTGPAYVTGFQPTMIFDKYLVNMDTELNMTRSSSLSDLAFEMQDFCVQNNNAFIINFIKAFNAANQSTTAHKLWLSMSQPETVSFQFQPPAVANSSYNLNTYLNQTYQNITLLTGADLFTRSTYEQTDSILNRPGLMISHLDDQYATTPDFLMTQQYHRGLTLEDLVTQFYENIPIIKYNTTNINNTIIEKVYLSPIGPGILRMLDSIGYSTVLTRTNYTTEGNVKTPKSRSMCDDSNTNHGGLKPSPSATSHGDTIYLDGIHITTFILAIFFIVF